MPPHFFTVQIGAFHRHFDVDKEMFNSKLNNMGTVCIKLIAYATVKKDAAVWSGSTYRSSRKKRSLSYRSLS